MDVCWLMMMFCSSKKDVDDDVKSVEEGVAAVSVGGDDGDKPADDPKGKGPAAEGDAAAEPAAECVGGAPALRIIFIIIIIVIIFIIVIVIIFIVIIIVIIFIIAIVIIFIIIIIIIIIVVLAFFGAPADAASRNTLKYFAEFPGSWLNISRGIFNPSLFLFLSL
jgi:amino acid transporter